MVGAKAAVGKGRTEHRDRIPTEHRLIAHALVLALLLTGVFAPGAQAEMKHHSFPTDIKKVCSDGQGLCSLSPINPSVCGKATESTHFVAAKVHDWYLPGQWMVPGYMWEMDLDNYESNTWYEVSLQVTVVSYERSAACPTELIDAQPRCTAYGDYAVTRCDWDFGAYTPNGFRASIRGDFSGCSPDDALRNGEYRDPVCGDEFLQAEMYVDTAIVPGETPDCYEEHSQKTVSYQRHDDGYEEGVSARITACESHE